MDSMPPASTVSAVPERIWSAASITAFSPEPHILLMVVAGTLKGTPASSAAWRAGAWPRPAGSTHPMMTSCTSAPLTPALSSAALMAALPSCTAVRGESAPRNAPMGVRLADTMTTSEADIWASFPADLSARQRTPCPPPRRPAGAQAGGAAARTQAPLEYGHKRRGDLRARQGLILTIPVRDPVESARECESGHFRIARPDRAVLHPFADQAADPLVDLGFQALDVPAHRRRQVL